MNHGNRKAPRKLGRVKGKRQDAVANAARSMVEQLEQRVLLSGAVNFNGPQWLPQGPQSTFGSTTALIPAGATPNDTLDNPAAGAVQAIATLPNTPDIYFVGTTNGGVWSTQTGGSLWHPLGQFQRSLSVGALAVSPFESAIDPSDPQQKRRIVTNTQITATTPVTAGFQSNLIVYAGFAVASHGGSSSFQLLAHTAGARRGVMKSLDGGKTWIETGVQLFEGLDVQKIVPSTSDPNTFLVAVTSPATGKS